MQAENKANTAMKLGLLILPFLSFLSADISFGQTRTQNYVRESVLLEEFKEDPSTDYDMARSTVTYYDGLGRPTQVVRSAATGNLLNLHYLTEYDNLGNPVKEWLPTEGNGASGEWMDPVEMKGTAIELYGDSHPFTETKYLHTLENIPKSVIGPGEDWAKNDRMTSVRSGLNYSSLPEYSCPRFDVASDGSLILKGDYEDGCLSYEKTVTESGLELTKFTDTEGRVILERRYADKVFLDTYYVYNTVGLLTFVLPPKASEELLAVAEGPCDMGIVKNLGYSYSYDSYGRMIEKRLPGTEPVYFVYDRLDNVIMQQDGNLRRSSRWYVIKLDERYRKAVEGLAVLKGETRESLQSKWGDRLAIEKPISGYSNVATLFYTDTCGIAGFEPKVSYFYDNYEVFKGIDDVSFPSDPSFPAGLDDATGLLTGKAVWEDWYGVLTAYKYDDRGRTVMETEINLDTYSSATTFSRYDFIGNRTAAKQVHHDTVEMRDYTSEYQYEYHSWGEVQSVRHRVDGEQWTTLINNYIDGTGRIYSTSFSPRKTRSRLTTDYTYNPRGWIIGITAPSFCQTLNYADAPNGTDKRWDGSPSAMTFTSIGPDGNSQTIPLSFGYDGFDRLTSVRQTDGNNDRPFSESFSYDSNGNAVIVTRGNISANPVQYLSISYDGNRISSVNESKDIEGLYPEIPSIPRGDYPSGWTYDANGNRTSDPSRGIVSITYNHLNQPEVFTFSDGSKLTNLYRSDGSFYGHREYETFISTVNAGNSKSKTFRNDLTTRFGSLEYVDGKPVRMYIDGGYVDYDLRTDTTSYRYYVRDYLGSVRVVIDEYGKPVQSADYSAYGVPSTRFNGFKNDRHLHLGLEWQSMRGINGYYNNARFRDAILAGSFYQQDPLAEKYYPFNPYNYSACNPLKFADQNGMDWITAIYDAERYYFHDRRIKNQNDIYEYYSNGSYIEYVGEATIEVIGDKTTGSSKTVGLGKDGVFSVDGEIISSEYHQDNVLHIGNDKNLNQKTINNNFYGSYMGPNNPKTKSKKDSYVVPPTDYQDYAAFKHDKGYDNLSVSGFKGTLNPQTSMTDLKFIYDLSKYSHKSRCFNSFLGGRISKILFTLLIITKNGPVSKPYYSIISNL